LLRGLFALITLVLVTFVLFWKGLWAPVVPSAMAFMVSGSLMAVCMFHQQKAQKDLLMRLFSSHVSGDVAEELWERKDEFMRGGRPRSQELTATVLFSDIRGFTSMSEGMEFQTLVDWLNAYMETMAKEITAHHGILSKYMGDGIMAVFGIPVPRTRESEVREDAVNAVCCAIGMGESLKRLNKTWADQGQPEARIRIGIQTGPVTVGCIGPSNRLEYAVIGETVNIASRLETVRRDSDPESMYRILIGGTTRQYLGDLFHLAKLMPVPLKGLRQMVDIYKVLGKA
jgi:adenylate cyclase